jgi:hypothetical protein
MSCLICGRPGTAVWALTTNPIHIVLCQADQDRWAFYGISIRPDVPVAGLRSLPPPLAQPFHQSAEAAGTQAEAG